MRTLFKALTTLIASLAFRDDSLWQVMGCMGADGQPQIHLQAYTAIIDWGLDVEPTSNIVDVYVGYLRQKLEAAGESRLIHTVRGAGYVLRES